MIILKRDLDIQSYVDKIFCEAYNEDCESDFDCEVCYKILCEMVEQIENLIFVEDIEGE